MPVASDRVAIKVRHIVDLYSIISRQRGVKFDISLICARCQKDIVGTEKRILFWGEFEHFACFRKLATDKSVILGLPEKATDEDINALLVPCEIPGIDNLFQPKTVPIFQWSLGT